MMIEITFGSPPNPLWTSGTPNQRSPVVHRVFSGKYRYIGKSKKCVDSFAEGRYYGIEELEAEREKYLNDALVFFRGRAHRKV